MDVNVRTQGAVTVVELAGELDASSTPAAQQQVGPLASGGSRLVLDMSRVTFMSSAGLRMLLSTYRQATAGGGQVVLAGLTEELRDTMSMTGFLTFFATSETVDSGIRTLAS